jgi:hypothetical protein
MPPPKVTSHHTITPQEASASTSAQASECLSAAECSSAAPADALQLQHGAAQPISLPSSPSLDTHWHCSQGLMWPQDVMYMSQCPKGHSLSSCSSLPCCHVCGGDGSVCMTCAQGCLYGICQLCMTALKIPLTCAVSDSVESCPLGVTPAFLKAFKAKWSHVTRGWTTGQVCHQLVKSLTCRSTASVCEDLMRQGGGEVGRATVVLSHCWENLFEDTVDAAVEAAEGDSFSEQVSGGGDFEFYVIACIMMIAAVVPHSEMNLFTSI